MYAKETEEQKKEAEKKLLNKNKENKEQHKNLVPQACAALRQLEEKEANSRA